MISICLYFQAHQPHRLRRISPFDIGKGQDPIDHALNAYILHRVADNCYLPTNELLLRLIEKGRGTIHLAFSLSGCLIDQLEQLRPDVIASFQQLAATSCVEFMGETYEHSLAALWDKEEFVFQVNKHREKIQKLFGQSPRIFRNTELIYTDHLSKWIGEMGFEGILTEGAERILGKRSPHQLFKANSSHPLPLLLRDFERSDDIAFRFNNEEWELFPLDVEKYHKLLENGPIGVRNIFMDYETFGEHQGKTTNLFHFLSEFIQAGMGKFSFNSPSQILNKFSPKEPLNVPDWLSWADTGRDVSAWMGNDMQLEALQKVYSLKKLCLQQPTWLQLWRRLLQSDHFYYMATKEGADAEVHEYFSPYRSPHDAYLVYMNVLSDFEQQLM